MNNEAAFGRAIETIISGGGDEAREACNFICLNWKSAPVDKLLELKKRLGRLGMENREARLDESLSCIAEKLPEPFMEVAREFTHPCWKQAVEIITAAKVESCHDTLVSMLPICNRKDLPPLIRAVGSLSSPKAYDALLPYMLSNDKEIVAETVYSLMDSGGKSAAARILSLAGSGNEVLKLAVDECLMADAM